MECFVILIMKSLPLQTSFFASFIFVFRRVISNCKYFWRTSILGCSSHMKELIYYKMCMQNVDPFHRWIFYKTGTTPACDGVIAACSCQ
jgi:hypothetical protein